MYWLYNILLLIYWATLIPMLIYRLIREEGFYPVSYTHLTLPTSDLGKKDFISASNRASASCRKN